MYHHGKSPRGGIKEMSYFGVHILWLGNIVETRWLNVDMGRLICGYKGCLGRSGICTPSYAYFVV